MTLFKNYYQMCKATDEEIKDFFASTIFEGVFSSEIKSSHTDYYKGHIHSIKINGEPNNVIGNHINVPINAIDIPEGPCTFKCRVKEEIRNSKNQIVFAISPRTLRSKYELHSQENEGELTNENVFELWGVDNCECIGYYHYDTKTNGYIINDLRKTNFDRIPPYLSNNQEISLWLKYPVKGLELDNYYRFTWKLSHKDKNNPYEIYLDNRFPPQTITPRWFIDNLFEDRHSDKSKNFGSAANFLDTLSKQLSAKESTFVYELLQNANDYPVEGQKVDVEFHITDNYLLFLHSGDKFNVRNISGICGINEKEKVANKKTIGYKGIGFKTVFLNNHYVYLRTGEYSFRFDEGESPEKKRGGKIKRQNAPFQILPIWTEHNEVSTEVNSVFDKADKKFQVQIALRPDNKKLLHVGKNCYENLFREVFSDSNIILFIPNINSVRVFINGIEERACFRNNEEWIVGDYEKEIGENLQSLINKTIDKGNSRIPEKYKDFDYTRVSFACKHDGEMIKSVEDATLYCYLPTKASWGFPFLMNTDMIPKGDRNDIETEVKLLDEEDTNFNEELASIAGAKLFHWIQDLLTSRNYHLGSVFSLVPDFNKCKREHKEYTNFIEKFEVAFEDCLETEDIVPISNEIAPINTIILDTIGLSSSGIMTDEEFLKFTCMEDYYLPLPILRKDKNFNSFLKRYAIDEQKFEKENLDELIDNEDFQEWLKNQDNNNKFLNFLLKNDYLEDLLDKNIFIEEECGSLYSAEELYYNIDEELKDLSAFSSHIEYLSLETRKFFKNNKKWNEIIKDKFAEFDGEYFINDILLNEYWDETIEALGNWDTSFHFYNYIAKNGIVPEELYNLPFFNDEETPEIVDDFNDKFIFISSKSGKKTCATSWLSQVSFAFVSAKYNKTTLDYLKKHANVLVYSDEIIVKDIILSDDYHDNIDEAQQEDENASVEFVKFCYNHKSLFTSGSLRHYALNAIDWEGNNNFVLYENNLFFPSACFDEYSQKEWLDSDWMYCLDSNYLTIDSDKKKIKSFLEDTFYVEELNASIFYKKIVKQKIDTIIENTSGSNDSDGKKNLDFISYLDENYKLIFEEEKDAEIFDSFVFLGDTKDETYYDIEYSNQYLYNYNDELKDILDSDWFPSDTVNMCSKDYGESKAITAIRAKSYKFSEFFDDVITEELENINETIETKESSIAFHSFVIERLRDLTDTQKEVMKGAKVYLYGSEESCDNSSGHKILSKSARELSDMGLVEFADLDIIDPDYHIEENEDYWKKHLDNDQFTITDFFKWLLENTDSFYEKIEDKDNNIKFWRWVKGCKLGDKTLEELPTLPIYLNTDDFIDSNEIIYLSDSYIDEGGLETIVKSYNPEAAFISSEYIYENDKIETWKDFWVKLGIRFEMIDIIIDTIDNRLDEIEDDKLPGTIAKYHTKLDEHYDGELISKLTNLRIKAHDGKFYTIDDTIYIDCEKDEPFSYIKLPNQISFDTAEQRKLIKDIIDDTGGDCIQTLSEWQQRKVDYYLEMQDDDCESVRNFHFMFINELSLIRNTSKDSLKEIENIENIYLLNRDNEFCEPTVLTMGSAYNPFFNFEKCSITTLEYVSDSYLSNCAEYPGKLFRALKVHCDIQEDDLSLLENRDCAIYFWSKYLIKKEAAISRIKDFISDNLFDDIDCIPTKDFMKSPKELYYGREVSKYVKNIEDWENKIPLMDLPDIKTSNDKTLFDELPFKKSLDFLDGLYALISVLGQDRRTQILEWMIEDYDETYQDKVSEYREDEHALWNNNRNEPVHIKQLYALNYEEKTLEQYFGQNPRIVNKAYFPVGLSFNSACDILGIKIISLCDLKMEPLGDTPFTQRNNDLKLFALVIAGMIDTERWQELYNGYIEKINSLVLHRCKSIMITYKDDEDINQSLRKFYHEAGSNDFYFVDSLDGKRVYTLFVKEFTEFIGVEKDDIPQEMIEDIMDSRENALELIREQNTLMLDEAFKDALDELIPGIKRELNGNIADDDDETPITYRPTFTTTESKVDEDDEDTTSLDISDRTDNANDNEVSETPSDKIYGNTETNGSSISDSGRNLTHSSEGQNQHDNLDVESGPSKPRLDKDSTHDYPTTREPRERKYSSNATPTKSSEGTRSYSDMNGWEGSRNSYTPQAPKPYSPEDVRNFGSRGVTRTQEVLEPTMSEISEINSILGGDLSAEEIADQNYITQLRLYNSLINKGYTPDESKEDFVRNGHIKNEHTITGGKYIHKCSAAGGIMYLSPSVWNKIADDNCIVCVYLGAKANEFMYLYSIDDILEWVGEDDIIIKLTGEEKADVVQELYSGVLCGVKGTAYTLIRINSNEKYNSLFAQLPTNNEINDTEENEDEY